MNMLRFRTLLTAAAASASLASAALAQGAKRPMSIDDMMALRNVGAASITPNGALVGYQVSAWEHPSANPAKGDTALGD